ncbi:MFS transporter [Haloplanus rallus]|uniref:Lysosomal dipeptide transporter MFSD1 n=1 Tax=Haloplanus rallus TaxID=1816183 RepID=A0A6B9F2R5_9EURY|nr:MFS transporter [Haloplanus rallus]QGX93522.1 MFS transporter [Haloplanus rallus]
MRRRRAALWTVLAAGFLFVNFHRTATAVLADSLARTFDATGAELGLLHASFFYVYAPLQLPAGLIVDRYGPRRVGAGGLGLLTLGVAWFALSESLATAFLARAVVGLGGSVLYIGTLRFCANWFRADEYATMTGYTVAAAGLGGILATTPLAVATGAVGWRTATLATAATTGVLTLAIAGFVRDTPEQAGVAAEGEGAATAADGEGAATAAEGEGAATAADGEGASDTGAATLADVVANVRTVVGERETWLMGAILFCVLGVNFTVLGLWGVPFLVDTYGVSLARASTVVLVGNVGFVVGSPLLGALSDRLGRRTELVVATALLFTLAYAVLAVVPPFPVVAPVFFVALVANGGVALVFTIGKERHPPSVAGTVTGVVNGFGYFGAALLPALLGGVLDAYWTGETLNGARVYTVFGYRIAFGIAAAAGLVATLAALWLHRRERTVSGG